MSATTTDRVRQVTVTVAEVFCVIGTLVGVGVLGTEVDRTSGGALAADATLLAPAGPAFSIWSVVYAGLAAYTVWQWLPSRATDPRVRSTGWLAAASMVLNATWLLVTQQGWIWGSVVVIVALLATLVELVRRLTGVGPRGVVERVVLDGTFGLYLGWVSVATCANVFAAATDSGSAPGPAAAVAVLAVVAAVSVLYAYRLGARLSVAAALAWGLGWIAYGRLADEPPSDLVAIAALAAATVALLAPLALNRVAHSPVRRDVAAF
ncbi:TspO/MBR family protein [Nocardioides aequoreus]|uniref:TspO/MBR family protein n=1 Tax=Nocardioides aequoreus TaxID=397278 RepID=UPI0004C2E4F7|nr:TspO/MBR family protein [Nocardioides aequoreus]